MLQAQNTSKTCPKRLVAVGSNMPSTSGSVLETARIALELLSACESIDIVAESRFYQTPAFPAGSGPDFVNAVIGFETDLEALDVLTVLHSIEEKLGRTRQNRWESRVIDLDLLAFDDLVLPSSDVQADWMEMDIKTQLTEVPDQLILPHPRMHQRGFVLVPLMDIAPDWRHPVLKQTTTEMLALLNPDELAGIRPI